MALITTIISVAALGCALIVAELEPASAQESRAEDPRLTSRNAVQIARGLQPGDSLCETQRDGVRYIGGAGDPLLACIGSHSDAKRLVITSVGGPVSSALRAAQAIHQAQLDLTVLGLCYSSCANYLVPAAGSVSVAPYSAIILHGGPSDDIDELRVQLSEALRAAGAPEAAMERLIEEQLAQALALRREHDEFVSRHVVGRRWYEPATLVKIETDHADSPSSLAGVAVSEQIFRHCVPNTLIRRYWFPTNASMARDLEDIFGLGAIAFAGLDGPEPVHCTPHP